MLRRILPVAALAAAALPAASASAATYCVHQPAFVCAVGTIDEGNDLQAALTAAQGNAGADAVTVSAGSYSSGPYTYGGTGTNAVSVTGAGAATILSMPYNTYPRAVLDGNQGPLNVASVAITLPNYGNTPQGIFTGGNVDAVTVSGGSNSGGYGVRLAPPNGTPATVTNTTVAIPDDTATGISLEGTGYETASDDTLSAGIGLAGSNTGTVTASRLAIHGLAGGITATNPSFTVDDVVVHADDASNGMLLVDGSLVDADHLTLVGPGGAGGTGVRVNATSVGAITSAHVHDSIIRGVATTLLRAAGGGIQSNLSIDHSDADTSPGAISDTGNGALSVGAGMLDVDPLFVSATDAHLQSGSPVIGQGTPGNPSHDLDADSLSRFSPQSMGAFEFCHTAGCVSTSTGSTGGGGTSGGGTTTVPSTTPVADTPPADQPPAEDPPVREDPPRQPPRRTVKHHPTAKDLTKGLRGGRTRWAGGSYTFAVPDSASVVVEWVLVDDHGHIASRTVVGRGRASRTSAGKLVVRVTLTSAGRRLERGRNRLRLRVTATARGAGVTRTAHVTRAISTGAHG